MARVSATPAPDNPRWQLAERVTDAVRRRFSADVVAIGVHGALAHGDDTEDTDIDLVVVTQRPGDGPRPATRRIDGVVVDLGVITADQYLGHARTLSTGWPLAADQYLTTAATFDPDGWHELLRDTHLARLAEAAPGEFTALAREAWYGAYSAVSRARHLAVWHDTDAGLVALSGARVGAAVAEGLLNRTYFRDAPDAVRRTGLAGAPMAELGARLTAQAAELARRGRPVDGGIADLFD
ncbi:MAG: hypothetical protein AUG44_14290 [Actinobacteria bacterium 13_1_20CM_3_71_11]|nr:MAG: hypothetical protein AUG44_14290 [Actinobacteria bacterium 13_1_20CM_3_71_11]